MVRSLLLGAMIFGVVGCGVATKPEATAVKPVPIPEPEPKEIYEKVAPMPREVKGESLGNRN